MKASYAWGWQILDMGFTATVDPRDMTEEEKKKRNYVHEFLSPSVQAAECGWHGISYCIATIGEEERREFVLMFATKEDTPAGARWVNVTGDSKGAIAEAVWSLVFA